MKRRSWKKFVNGFPGPKQLSTLLQGRELGVPQKYGPLEIIPLLHSPIETGQYALPGQSLQWESAPQLRLQNLSELPVIAPLHLGAVEYGLPGQALTHSRVLAPKEIWEIDQALSLNPSDAQWHLLTRDRLISIPYMLRDTAYPPKEQQDPHALWNGIRQLSQALKIPEMELDPQIRLKWWKRLQDCYQALPVQAEQTGALMVLSGEVIGIELAPDPAVWADWWRSLCLYTYAPLLLLPVFERYWQEELAPASAAVMKIGSIRKLQAEASAMQKLKKQKAGHLLSMAAILSVNYALLGQSHGHRVYELVAGPFVGEGIFQEERPAYLSLFRRDRWQY